MSDLIKAPPRALAPAANVEEARAQLAVARSRLALRLEVLGQTLEPLSRVRAVVRKHPYLTLGGALLVGFTISRLFSRK